MFTNRTVSRYAAEHAQKAQEHLVNLDPGFNQTIVGTAGLDPVLRHHSGEPCNNYSTYTYSVEHLLLEAPFRWLRTLRYEPIIRLIRLSGGEYIYHNTFSSLNISNALDPAIGEITYRIYYSNRVGYDSKAVAADNLDAMNSHNDRLPGEEHHIKYREDITNLLKQGGTTEVQVFELRDKSTVIYLEQLTTDVLRKIYALLALKVKDHLIRYTTGEMSDVFKHVGTALAKEDYELYVATVKDFYHTHIVAKLEERERVVIMNAVKSSHNHAVDNIKYEIKRNQDSMREFEEKAFRAAREILDLQMKQTILLNSNDDVDKKAEELYKLLKSSPVATITQVGRHSLTMLINVALSDWDLEFARKLYEQNRAFEFNEHPWKRDLFGKLFVTCEYKLHFSQNITWDFSNFRADANRSNLTGTTYGNPHLHYHNCWGTYRHAIEKSMLHGDFEEAFMNILASVSSLNLLDSIVMSQFMVDLNTLTAPVLENLATGERLSPVEYRKAYNNNESDESESESD